MKRLLCSAICLVSLAALPLHGQTQPAPPSLKAIVDQAEKDAKARRYEAAINGYERAWEMSRDPLHHYNISVLMLMGLKDPLGAYRYAVLFAEEAVKDADRRDAGEWLAKVEKALAASHGKAVVTVTPRGASMWLDEKTDAGRLDRATLWTRPGDHVIRAEAEKHKGGETRFSLRPGETVEVRIALEPEPAVLKVECPTRGCTVSVDSGRVGEAPARMEVKPGRHVVRLEAPGFAAHEVEVQAGPAEQVAVNADLKPAPAPPKTAPVAQPVTVKPVPPRYRPLAWASVSTGAACLVAGSVLYALAHRELSAAGGMKGPLPGKEGAYYDEFYGKVWKGRVMGYSAYALWGLGAAAAGAGVYLFLTDRGGSAVAPAGPGGPGITAVVRW